MNLIDMLSTSAELRRAAEFARWMSALRLIGAGLVALGVVFEFVGELAGRQFERQPQGLHDVQIKQLADRIMLLEKAVTTARQPSQNYQSSSLDPIQHTDKSSELSLCPRAKQSTAL